MCGWLALCRQRGKPLLQKRIVIRSQKRSRRERDPDRERRIRRMKVTMEEAPDDCVLQCLSRKNEQRGSRWNRGPSHWSGAG